MKDIWIKGLFSLGLTLMICGLILTPSGKLWADDGTAVTPPPVPAGCGGSDACSPPGGCASAGTMCPGRVCTGAVPPVAGTDCTDCACRLNTSGTTCACVPKQ